MAQQGEALSTMRSAQESRMASNGRPRPPHRPWRRPMPQQVGEIGRHCQQNPHFGEALHQKVVEGPVALDDEEARRGDAGIKQRLGNDTRTAASSMTGLASPRNQPRHRRRQFSAAGAMAPIMSGPSGQRLRNRSVRCP